MNCSSSWISLIRNVWGKYFYSVLNGLLHYQEQIKLGKNIIHWYLISILYKRATIGM